MKNRCNAFTLIELVGGHRHHFDPGGHVVGGVGQGKNESPGNLLHQ